MKKIFLFLILLSISTFCFFQVGAVSVEVTESIPGAGCGSADADGIVTCNIPNWFWAISGVIGEVIKYFTYIAALASVLFIIINGIMYSMSWIDDGLKSAAKERITKTLMGLVLLMLSWAILNAVAPWIYK